MIHDVRIDVERQRLYLDDNATYARSVTYASGSTLHDLKMTLLRHRTGTGVKYPAIVFLSGGGWATQDFNAHIPELVGFAEAGYVVASVEYRLAGEQRFPAQLIDVKAAIRYLRAHAEALNIDVDRIGVLGESAGGHLAALVGTTGHTRAFDLGDYLDQDSAVQAACCYYPPVDLGLMTHQLIRQAEEENFIPQEPVPANVLHILLGGDPLKNPELVRRANPLTYLEKDAPPFCILHGTQDRTVPPAQGEMLYDALVQNNTPAELYRIVGAGHASIEFFQPKFKEIVLSFFDRVFK
jgi:acetyl esterase/lipase